MFKKQNSNKKWSNRVCVCALFVCCVCVWARVRVWLQVNLLRILLFQCKWGVKVWFAAYEQSVTKPETIPRKIILFCRYLRDLTQRSSTKISPVRYLKDTAKKRSCKGAGLKDTAGKRPWKGAGLKEMAVKRPCQGAGFKDRDTMQGSWVKGHWREETMQGSWVKGNGREETMPGSWV